MHKAAAVSAIVAIEPRYRMTLPPIASTAFPASDILPVECPSRAPLPSASKSAHRTRLQPIMEREESCDRALLVV
jgi:hypothetical protein